MSVTKLFLLGFALTFSTAAFPQQGICGITTAPTQENCVCGGTYIWQGVMPGVGFCIQTMSTWCCGSQIDSYEVRLPPKSCSPGDNCNLPLASPFSIARQRFSTGTAQLSEKADFLIVRSKTRSEGSRL